VPGILLPRQPSTTNTTGVSVALDGLPAGQVYLGVIATSVVRAHAPRGRRKLPDSMTRRNASMLVIVSIYLATATAFANFRCGRRRCRRQEPHELGA